MIPDVLKVACTSCGEHIEFPRDMLNSAIDCPHCGLTTALKVAGIEPVVIQQPDKPRWADIKRRSEFVGSGCAIQALGVLCFFFVFVFPVGTIVGPLAGVSLLIAGRRKAKFLECSTCGSRLSNKRVKLCPGCGSRFA